ncbi:hypothetical protein TRFO_15306 [Tritrichomonas foetus]|uniref:Uncharacterized protein n=1 Tax=Tritrichomonas foetus TaxID=1144522 RepID=A0A1J4KSV6_9EUKA|nr:hypothetical protein TRFO_15306 [Tritrichomonas foetus]|eukprot:OHT14375.1 hypothetical protein TRFO_15306 [Tritrichomonas foetus]
MDRGVVQRNTRHFHSKLRKQRCASVGRRSIHSRDLDLFLDVELNKNNFSLCSFAMGGMPYFELSGLSYDDSSNAKAIESLIAGRISPFISDLFEGIDLKEKKVPCFITDSRQSIAAKYQLVLSDGSKNSHASFKVVRTRRMSDSKDFLDECEGALGPSSADSNVLIPTRRKSKTEISKKSL